MTQLPSDPIYERLQNLRVCLAAHVRLSPQTYRGERWYVLADEARSRFMRIDSRAYSAIGRFNGRTTLNDVLNLVQRTDSSFSDQEMAGLVLQLANFDALRDPLPDDVRALTDNGKSALGKNLINPLALRFRLLDPDQFLDIAMPWVQPLFSRPAALFWILSLLVAAFMGVTQLNTLAAAINSSLLAPSNLALGLVIFAVMKVLHEFAHAFAVKRWGGEVHEMGISFLVLMPIPYVDASASWVFRNKYRRALVGAVGIFVELWIAAVALIVFFVVEPGMVRSAALTAFLVGGVSTLFINGNPLLRFDGYYVLQDLAELPNLSSRASRYIVYLMKRYLLGIDSAQSPVTATGERKWLLGYGISAAIYRLFILVGIGLFLASKYLAVGVVLVTWVVGLQIVLPLCRAGWFIIRDKQISGRRSSVIARAIALPAIVIALLAYVPVNRTTSVEGVVWLPEQAQLYAKSTGTIDKVLVTEGQHIDVGTPILQLVNADLEPRKRVLEARLGELDVRHQTNLFGNRSAADVTKEERKSVVAQLNMINEKISALTVKSQHAGKVAFDYHRIVEGNHINLGDLIAYTIVPSDYIVRSVVRQRDIGRVRGGVNKIEVLLAENLGRRLPATILRETPSGDTQLPSRALARAGGGTIDTDPGDRASLQSSRQVFNIDLALEHQTLAGGLGGRAHVRFTHSPEPLLSQWHERLRQLLLRHLSV